MASGRKIGEGRVDLTANAEPLEAGLDKAKASTQSWADSVTSIAKNVAAAIGTAYAAFRVGNQITQTIADMRDLHILTQDMRRSIGEPSAAFFSETQSAKITQRIDRLKAQFAEIGNAAGAGSKITQEQFNAAVKALGEKQRAEIDATTAKMDSFWIANDNAMTDDKEDIFRIAGFRKYSEVLKEVQSGIAQINKTYQDQINILKEKKAIDDATIANATTMQILARQESQRAGFSLGDQVLAESVVNRELGRIWSPPGGGRY